MLRILFLATAIMDMITETLTLPPDDLQRNLALARPNEDQKLPHIGLAGDTYTILLTGKDTAGRYCLIDIKICRLRFGSALCCGA